MRKPSISQSAVVVLALVTLALGVAPASAALPAPTPCPDCWLPKLHSRWQYQLQAIKGHPATGGINTTVKGRRKRGGPKVSPKVWDIDLFVDQTVSGNNTTLNTGAVDAIHALGGHVICYVDAGTWENWRADANQFPASVLGRQQRLAG